MKPRPKRFLRLRLLALMILALSSPWLAAMEPYHPVRKDPMLEPWRWHAFPELNGLATQCVGEGPGGSIWFGTADALWSYDGFEWVNHTNMHASGVASVCTGADTNLYFARAGDIWRLAGGEYVRVFHLPIHGLKVRKLIPARDGVLWAATSFGLLHLQRSQWTLYAPPKEAAQLRDKLQGDNRASLLEIRLMPESLLAKLRTDQSATGLVDFYEVCEDHLGRIWLGTRRGEIVCFQPGEAGRPAAKTPDHWTLYDQSNGLVRGTYPSILALQDGAVWVAYGVGPGCINIFTGATWRTLKLADVGVPGDGGDLLQTRDGTIWLSGRNVLAACRDGQWRTYSKPDQPIPSASNLLLETSDGVLWICGPGTEIERVDYETSRWLTLDNLNFGWESPDGTQWFLARNGRVVVHGKTGRWFSYGVEDGLMDTPVALLGTKSGDVWVAGSQGHEAAMARFDGKNWTRFVRQDFSWGVDWRAMFESSDGSIWFGAAVDSHGPKAHSDGILQYRAGQWIHHLQLARVPPGRTMTNLATILPPTQSPEPIGKYYLLGESRDKKIWAGYNVLVFNNGRKWLPFSTPPNIELGNMETMLTTKDRELWIGSQQFAALRYNGQSWQHFQGKGSLVANSVRSLVQTADGSIWAATDRDVSRFDGRGWTANLLPAVLTLPEQGGSLKASPSGALWINRFTRDWAMRAWPKATRLVSPDGEFWTIGHGFQGKPPRTVITSGEATVSSLGNISIFWAGTQAWREPRDSRLQYSYRLDEQSWSAYTTDGGHAFFALSSGSHHFEVRARDTDFNVDPTPAGLDFVVLPPVWRQAWFIALMLLLVGLIVILAMRVVLGQVRLRRAHDELEERVRRRTAQLEAANKELESFSYSVSHDLRTPLRSIDGFSRILLQTMEAKLDEAGRNYLQRVCAASQRMGLLIDDLLKLSRISRSELHRQRVDLSGVAAGIISELQKTEPERRVIFQAQSRLTARGDEHLIQIMMENLLGNAWKFTGRQPAAKIEFGMTYQQGETVFYVRDNGAGFNMAYADKLFGAFQRLHTNKEFPGTGIGLATVQRIIHRHGGRIWAESSEGCGATFYFTLPNNA